MASHPKSPREWCLKLRQRGDLSKHRKSLAQATHRASPGTLQDLMRGARRHSIAVLPAAWRLQRRDATQHSCLARVCVALTHTISWKIVRAVARRNGAALIDATCNDTRRVPLVQVVAIGAARRRKAPQGASVSVMLKYAANDNLKEALSKTWTIGPPSILAVPTVGNVIDKERGLTHI